MTACPHCGDTKSGYEYRATMVEIRVGSWGEQSESAGVVRSVFPKKVVCQSCKKRVDIDKAEGREP